MGYSTVASYRSSHVHSAKRAASNREERVPGPSWLVLIIMSATVAGLTWGVMQQRIPEIDPRAVIAINLTAAKLALQDERYLDPPEHSAAHYLNAVLAIDPTNEDAQRSLREIADRFVHQAKSAILEARFAEAALAIERAKRLQPNDRRLTFVETEFRRALDMHVSSRVLSAPESKSAAEPIPLTRSAANNTSGREEHASEMAARESTRAPLPVNNPPEKQIKEEQIHRWPDSLTASLSPPIATAHSDLPPTFLDYRAIERSFALVERYIGETLPAERDGNVANSATSSSIGVVESPAEFIPKGLKLVQPTYPQNALVRGLEGWVNLTLTVSPTGDVINARVEDRQGSPSFERAALVAARQWKYEPNAAGTNAPPATIPVRVAFQLKGSE